MSWYSNIDWGAVAGAAASAYSANAASKAAGQAGEQSAQGSREATALQREIYNDQRALMMPQYNAGNWALGMLTGSLGGPASWGGQQGMGQQPVQVPSNWFGNSGGPPARNEQLYATDPRYAAAWDQVGADHFAQYGKGYTNKTDRSVISTWLANAYRTMPGPQQPGQAAPQAQGLDPANRAKIIEMMRSTPGYQMGLDEGNKQIQSSAAARGGLNSGATLKALQKYGTDYADARGWQPYINQLQSLSGLAQTAGGQIGSYGQNFASQAGQNAQNAANARAQSTYQAANARLWGTQQAGNYLYDAWGANKQRGY